MKTLPYLKQLTYACIVLAFPFIFSASRNTDLPEPVQPPTVSPVTPGTAPSATLHTLKVTIDSLKSSSKSLLYPQK